MADNIFIVFDTHNYFFNLFHLTASCAQHFLLPDERLVVKCLIFFRLAILTLLQKCTSPPMTSPDLPKISSTLFYKITWHQFLFLDSAASLWYTGLENMPTASSLQWRNSSWSWNGNCPLAGLIPISVACGSTCIISTARLREGIY